ncbi:MAG: shikimate kinase [Candidatus Omnitrophica bacterium]|nr:shikimate kinase [Candidatus Omnitrophota bacterium]MCB9721273.1 shikimate kinase [Candidatus Omnitrophota bacterium]
MLESGMLDTRNIVLTGFMGSGKSMVSRELGEIYRREVLSTDELIEQREGLSIRDIFETRGEPYFREVEAAVVKEVAERQEVIIDCGGGVVIDPANITALRRTGIIFYLHTSVESVLKQVLKNQKRPLLNVADPEARVRQLLTEREPLYRQADYTLETADNSVDEIVIKMREILDHD